MGLESHWVRQQEESALQTLPPKLVQFTGNRSPSPSIPKPHRAKNELKTILCQASRGARLTACVVRTAKKRCLTAPRFASTATTFWISRSWEAGSPTTPPERAAATTTRMAPLALTTRPRRAVTKSIARWRPSGAAGGSRRIRRAGPPVSRKAKTWARKPASWSRTSRGRFRTPRPGRRRPRPRLPATSGQARGPP